jgi:hypothetical protein
MEGGELFQRIQEKQAFNERGKNIHTWRSFLNDATHDIFTFPFSRFLVGIIVSNIHKTINHLDPSKAMTSFMDMDLRPDF